MSNKISILVPMYNVEKYLKNCLKSICNQTYKDIDIVLVDDGSTDKTYEIAKQFADKDSRIRLLHKENEKSLSKTRNFLLKQIQCPYFCFIDSDDCVEKDYVEKLYNELINNDADCSCCGYTTQLFYFPVLRKFSTSKKVFYNDECLKSILLSFKSHFVLWNKLYKTKLAEGITFPEETSYGEDFIYCYEYFKRCKKTVYNNVKLYHYFNRPGSIMHTKFGQSKINFYNWLKFTADNEGNKEIANDMKAWLSYTCAYFAYAIKKTKYDNENLYQEFCKNSILYKDLLLNNKRTFWLIKLTYKYFCSKLKMNKSK